MNEHRTSADQSKLSCRRENSSEPLPTAETDVYPINKKYRFRRHVLKGVGKGMVIWELQKRQKKYGVLAWGFFANDRSPVRLGLYCERLNIRPDPENMEMLSSLADE